MVQGTRHSGAKSHGRGIRDLKHQYPTYLLSLESSSHPDIIFDDLDKNVDVSGLYLQVLNTKDKQGIQGFLYFAKFFQEIIVISSRHHLHYKKRA